MILKLFYCKCLNELFKTRGFSKNATEEYWTSKLICKTTFLIAVPENSNDGYYIYYDAFFYQKVYLSYFFI